MSQMCIFLQSIIAWNWFFHRQPPETNCPLLALPLTGPVAGERFKIPIIIHYVPSYSIIFHPIPSYSIIFPYLILVTGTRGSACGENCHVRNFSTWLIVMWRNMDNFSTWEMWSQIGIIWYVLYYLVLSSPIEMVARSSYFSHHNQPSSLHWKQKRRTNFVIKY